MKPRPSVNSSHGPARHNFVHRQLQKQRADDGEKLQRGREQKNLPRARFSPTMRQSGLAL